MKESQILKYIVTDQTEEGRNVHRVLLRVEVVFSETESRFGNVSRPQMPCERSRPSQDRFRCACHDHRPSKRIRSFVPMCDAS